MQQGTPLAIDGKGIYFYFDRKKKTAVLNDVNISMTKGVIYSLLGPSGCGKTTLLKCIVGQHKLQVGSLKVYGKVPCSKGFFIPGRGVGYMPQNMALYPEMTTQETLKYFGSLYFMNHQETSARIFFLVKLLSLPDKNKLIKHLSGGQQRRVSLAAALIHRPPLLILDEPTVGLDPLLRQNIWNHLVALAKDDQLTIIITTHYIEEARQADIVGLMRDGHLLAERNPEDLIKQYQATTLENVFLRLCQNECNEYDNYKTCCGIEDSEEMFLKNSSNAWISKEENKQCSHRELLGKREQAFMLSPMKSSYSSEVNNCSNQVTFGEKIEDQDNAADFLAPDLVKNDFVIVNQTFEQSWKRMLCLTKKNYLRFRRNYLFVAMQILVPCIEMAVFCVSVGAPPFGLPVAVLNAEKNPGGFGKHFLHSVNNRTILQKEYNNFSEAIESVKTGESWATIYIGPEFSNCLYERFMLGAEVDNATTECSEIKLYLDMSNQIIAATIYSDLLRGFQSFASDILLKNDKSPTMANLPVVVKDPIYGSLTSSITEFIGPGILLSVIYILAVTLTSLTIIIEKKQGLLERTFVAGASHMEVLSSHFIVLLVALFMQVLFVSICTFYIFNISCNGPFLWVVFGIFLTGVGGMAYGMFISSATDDETAAVFLTTGSIFPNLLLSGIIWPVEGMHYYLRYFSYFLPLTVQTNSLRSIISRGWSISDHHTWDGYLISAAWVIVFLSLSLLFFKIRK